MEKTAVLIIVLIVSAMMAVAGHWSGPFKEIFGIREQSELCMGADDDGIANAEDNYQCVAREDLPTKAKDRITGTIRYYLVMPEGFMTAGSRGLKITGLDPDKSYQIKLDSWDSFEGGAFSIACSSPNQGGAWQCGMWTEPDTGRQIGFVVLDTLQPDRRGVLTYNMPHPLDLSQGIYDNVNVVVTENERPWRNVALGNVAFIVTG